MGALVLFGDEPEPVPVMRPWSTAYDNVPLHEWFAAAQRMEPKVAYCPDGSPAARPALGGCWWWCGAISSTGHGRATLVGRRQVGSHVLAWVAAHRAGVPAGMVVRHRCDEPSCVRPDHLEVGTQLDNIADRIHRGRQYGGDTRGPAGRARAARDWLLAHPDKWDGLADVLAAGSPGANQDQLPGL